MIQALPASKVLCNDRKTYTAVTPSLPTTDYMKRLSRLQDEWLFAETTIEATNKHVDPSAYVTNRGSLTLVSQVTSRSSHVGSDMLYVFHGRRQRAQPPTKIEIGQSLKPWWYPDTELVVLFSR